MIAETPAAAKRHSTVSKRSAEIDADKIARELHRSVEGEVRFDDGSRSLYAYDGSIYRQVPIGVVIPKTIDDVVTAVSIARHHDAPILGRGGGTSLAGQCCNFAIVIDFSKYLNTVVSLDPDAKQAVVLPGLIRDHLNEAAGKYGLMFAPDPQTHDRCTLGGMIGNNSCGTHSIDYGKTVDNTHELEILTYDGLRMHVGPTSSAELERIIAQGGRRGEIYAGLKRIRDRYADVVRTGLPKIPRRVSGYNLDELLPENNFNVARALVGTESTCALTLGAIVRLVHSPPYRTLVVVGFKDIPSCGYAVPFFLSHKPMAVEFFSQHIMRNLHAKGMHFGAPEVLPEGGEAYVIVEFGGETQEEANARAAPLMRDLHHQHGAMGHRALTDAKEKQAVLNVRQAGVGASRTWTSIGGHPGWPNWEDAAVPPDRLGDYLRDQLQVLAKHHYDGVFYGHLGQGCIHCRINFDLRSAQGIKNFRAFMEDASDLVVSYGGSLSGEHGDGHGRAELWPKMFSPELMQAFREFKLLWDPGHKMNPGKLIDPYRMDQHLREGSAYETLDLDTYFSYREDGFSFAEAAGRCFGVGKCRHTDGGTMCPSFMATREERHSTRGRAHLLQEMMRTAGTIKDRWKSREVKEALDLCLACKGCRGDCPVRVDMATYKAEFLAHHYRGKLRPRSAYAMGLVMLWARLAARAPRLVNAVTHAPLLSNAVKFAGGVAQERELPRFAEQTFTEWFRTHKTLGTDAPRVILWPDTFNNFFLPQTAIAATEVLEAAGFHVELPRSALCCGRPLYDYGMLSMAKSFLARILRVLRDEIREGIPVVGLEPSCVAVFRDEMVNLFPHDLDAERLAKQTFTLAEFLDRAGWKPPKMDGKALVQRHCHHQAVMGFDADKKMLDALGLELDIPDSGCCGMAGSFGYEHGEHYDVSMKCAERTLLPKVREASPDTLLVADGFSCREQIAQNTGRTTVHLADVLRRAIDRAPQPASAHPAHTNGVAKRIILIAAGSLLAGAAIVWRGNH
ncbi:MAG TPA: FAD-linked oxidase C-terminal domain-containing protein [Candidatus Acidoferrales bacterium]|nr:FAD-linked oxidase C-terminal domain-containing protein [Candidatus Acidoferrales bacterium]